MQSKQFVALMYGWIVIFGLILVASFSLALLLRFSSFSQPALDWVTLVVGLITLFLGGLIAGMKGKAKGWMIGAITGAGFTLFTFLVQYLGYQQAFSIEQMIHHIFYILAALFGGVIGVNTVTDENNN
ncbi:TIGR04086 family membrane protein [Ornithinibacillus sp. L9]|uniref:TIGR04086 family membrane protein n=1 Tax=Ornithinibacillus caprae TaxID=2678566 RepID=A0A6N8FG26_9BACI|nr:TIGR04086 family membrane protein [Ornithinibacillus caprae]MUK86997.1 TIGR04086 family membrane protein [Ornithinibacillus caprae]